MRADIGRIRLVVCGIENQEYCREIAVVRILWAAAGNRKFMVEVLDLRFVAFKCGTIPSWHHLFLSQYRT